jgi:hypothetical protein
LVFGTLLLSYSTNLPIVGSIARFTINPAINALGIWYFGKPLSDKMSAKEKRDRVARAFEQTLVQPEESSASLFPSYLYKLIGSTSNSLYPVQDSTYCKRV